MRNEKLEAEDKSVVEEKLKQIKELQEQITNLLVWKKISKKVLLIKK